MAQARSTWAINRWKNQGSVIYSIDRKNEANKMFIASKTKCRKSNLTGIRKWKFWLAQGNNRTLQGLFSIKSKIKMQLHHVEKVYLVKLHVSAPLWKSLFCQTKSTVCIRSPMLRWSFLGNGRCVWLGVASIFLSLVFEKTLQMAKELVKMIRGRYVCREVFLISFVEGITCFL